MTKRRTWATAAIVVAVGTLATAVPAFTAQEETFPDDPQEVDRHLRDLVRFGLDTAGAAAKVEVVPPEVIGGTVQLHLDVPAEVDLPLTLETVINLVKPAGEQTTTPGGAGLEELPEHREMLDDLVLTGRIPDELPVQVCARITVNGKEAVPVGQFSLGGTPLRGASGGFVPATPTELADQGLACPDGWLAAGPTAVLTAPTVPVPMAAPLSMRPDSLAEVVTSVVQEVSIAVQLRLQTALPDNGPTPDSCAGQACVVSKEITSPPLTLPVPGLPVPDLGIGFGGEIVENDEGVAYVRGHDNWFSLVAAVPPGSALASTAEALDLLHRLQSMVLDAKGTVDGTVAVVEFLSPVEPTKTAAELKAELLDAYGKLLEAFALVIPDTSLPDGAEFAGVRMIVGNDDDLCGDCVVDRRGADDDVGVTDDLRSLILFGPTHVWCWYRDDEFQSEDQALVAYTRPGFVRIYRDTANEDEMGPGFEGTGIDPGNVTGDDDGVSAWQWFERGDRTGFEPGRFPADTDEDKACRSGGHDRTPLNGEGAPGDDGADGVGR